MPSGRVTQQTCSAAFPLAAEAARFAAKRMTITLPSPRQETGDPRSKYHVVGSSSLPAACTWSVGSEVVELHQDTFNTSTKTVSGASCWLSKDPIGIRGGLNQHVAFGNNPVNFRDPSGMATYPADFIGPVLPGDVFTPWPTKPPGASVMGNATEAQMHIPNAGWFRDQVRAGGPWDYKTRGCQYENFGNFNYGAVGAAFGFPLDVLLKAAGLAQIEAGTSQPGWGEPSTDVYDGGTPPYGDDPRDQTWIESGFNYFDDIMKK